MNKNTEKISTIKAILDEIENDSTVLPSTALIDTIDQVSQWQVVRNLQMIPFKQDDEVSNILEEMIESYGLSSSDSRQVAKHVVSLIHQEIQAKDCIQMVTDEDMVDAFFDTIVYAVGSMLKLGYNPIGVMSEGLKHIEGRKGRYEPEIGKYVKEPSGHLYQPQYNQVTLVKMPLALPNLPLGTENAK